MFTEDIVCSRSEDGKANVNIEHKIIRHSSDGFEWGYGDSGPAELALNIMHEYFVKDIAERFYQDSKIDFIAKLPREGGTIVHQDVVHWLYKKMNKDK